MMFDKKSKPSIRKFVSPHLFIFILGLGLGVSLHPFLSDSRLTSTHEKAVIQACFTPGGRCTHKIVSAIDKAQSPIFVQAYSFTSVDIANALIKAFKRGVDVQILLDKSQLKEKHSQLSSLAQSGIPVFIDSPKGIAHNKVMIIDQTYVLTGSFNFTKAAELRNTENILFIEDPSLAHLYEENWIKRALKSRRYLP